jgi:hypothetical protein
MAVPLLWRGKLHTGAAFDLTPSTDWPTPVLSGDVRCGSRPVLMTLEYQVRPDDRGPFLEALDRLGSERRRDGAFEWAIFEDLSPGRPFSRNVQT